MDMKCFRNLDTCQPCQQFASEGLESFVCAGLNDGRDRSIEQDVIRFCFKNAAGDDMYDLDERDATHMIACLSIAHAAHLEDQLEE